MKNALICLWLRNAASNIKINCISWKELSRHFKTIWNRKVQVLFMNGFIVVKKEETTENGTVTCKCLPTTLFRSVN